MSNSSNKEEKLFEITVQFEAYEDLLRASKWLKNTDVNRTSLVNGFIGDVEVSFGYALQDMIDQGREG
jgi:hypothetical protein